MEAYQQRVIDERDDLNGKLLRLKAFMGSATFQALPMDERHRLAMQRVFMSGYAQVLDLRIEAFGVIP